MFSRAPWRVLPLLILVVAAWGCTPEATEDPRVSAERKKFLLQQEPSGALTLTDAAQTVPIQPEVTLVGQITAGELDPFQENQASFVISEAPEGGHGGPDHADDCAFCRRRQAKAPKAAIRLVDVDGKVLPIDARKLLQVEKGDVVVVTGNAQYDATLNQLNIEATGVYVRERPKS
ncbi:hypothetical protein [Lignipirellula cremea]|uniref:DUF5666 domain-containing protein n=1 Tax=Lignipirellula cremea TaxID=2528010 RepID=A0A518DY75_9BACT|nr:hypothetical protein [Lignipirellula cremea]QDU96797.1 hypothetical protein Pla8534_46180 [Lignipirellula cremea]